MTIDDLKKLDKRIRQIQDPFGAGLPSLRRITEECARDQGIAMSDAVRQYAAWKLKK